VKKAIWILWPSFLVAGVAEVLLFTLVDPGELGVGRAVAYTVGFFLLWGFAAASSAFTCFLQKSAAEINACPLQPAERPLGCPKRDCA
jgi:hypothetical protein